MSGELDQTYGWMIDEDRTATAKDGPPGTNTNAAGMIGPRGIDDALTARLKALEGRKFRMLDDDGEVYYLGRIITSVSGTELDFRPLDDFGAPNAGCTTIEYQDNAGRWATL